MSNNPFDESKSNWRVFDMDDDGYISAQFATWHPQSEEVYDASDNPFYEELDKAFAVNQSRTTLTKHEKLVALSIYTDFSFGVSLDDMVDFANKFGSRTTEYVYQEVLYFPKNFMKALEGTCVDCLADSSLDLPKVKRTLGLLNSEARVEYMAKITDKLN